LDKTTSGKIGEDQKTEPIGDRFKKPDSLLSVEREH
jgi:hypothetical protein